MRVIRSSRCSLHEATRTKHAVLTELLTEYGRVVNVFIQRFWSRRWSKRELVKENIVVEGTWLSARLRKVAAREAIDMVAAARERDGRRAHRPVHHGQRMYVSSTIASLRSATSAGEFDAWLHVASVGRKIVLDFPIRFHRHYRKYSEDPRARRLESYVVTADSVQLAFELEVDPVRSEGGDFGLDTGVKALATLSDGRRFGTDIRPILERIDRCAHGSHGQQRARRALRQRIAEVAKEVVSLDPRLIVVEDLKGLHHGTRRDRRLSKKMRRSLGAWTYREWLGRLNMACETNRVRFERVPPSYSSQRCHVCGHTERGNRKGEEFRCRGCGYLGNADENAARNLLIRFGEREFHPAGAYSPPVKAPRAP
ncbi:MAG TPA: transposase [Thermoplasmata archaeon]|nr:transposase [Thermoplasmata archaeon]